MSSFYFSLIIGGKKKKDSYSWLFFDILGILISSLVY